MRDEEPAAPLSTTWDWDQLKIPVSRAPPQVSGQRPGRANRVGLVLVLLGVRGAPPLKFQVVMRRSVFASRAVAGDTLRSGGPSSNSAKGPPALLPSFDVVGFACPAAGPGARGCSRRRGTGRTGELRRGVADGHTPADAAARAVLHALNRSL